MIIGITSKIAVMSDSIIALTHLLCDTPSCSVAVPFKQTILLVWMTNLTSCHHLTSRSLQKAFTLHIHDERMIAPWLSWVEAASASGPWRNRNSTIDISHHGFIFSCQTGNTSIYVPSKIFQWTGGKMITDINVCVCVCGCVWVCEAETLHIC